MAQRSVPAPFLTKTYQLVEDGESDDVVSWSENGTTFVVWKTAEFAKDVLPNYFKHNNFSSFVRQLNTYGFRKIVPDKWEFANEYFKKGQKQLLTEIRRRKTAHASPAGALKTHGGGASSPSNSGEDLGSTSTSSPETRSPRSAGAAAGPVLDLSGENEKLKRHNEILSSELAQTKKQCEELVAFLTEQVKVGPDQIDRILRQGTCGSSRTGSEPETTFPTDDDDNEEEEEESGEEQRLKLFGVWLNGKKNRKKRGREENIRCGGPHPKGMKAWMMMKMATPPPAETSKVCN